MAHWLNQCQVWILVSAARGAEVAMQLLYQTNLQVCAKAEMQTNLPRCFLVQGMQCRFRQVSSLSYGNQSALLFMHFYTICFHLVAFPFIMQQFSGINIMHNCFYWVIKSYNQAVKEACKKKCPNIIGTGTPNPPSSHSNLLQRTQHPCFVDFLSPMMK